MPSWAARMAVTYPPGPDPMTMQSKLSAMKADDTRSALGSARPPRRLHARHHADELPEEPAGARDDQQAQHHRPEVGRDQQRSGRVDAGDGEQALEAEHG